MAQEKYYMVIRVKKPYIHRILKSRYDYDRNDRVFPKKWEDEFPLGGLDNCWRVHAVLASNEEVMDYRIRERMTEYNLGTFGYRGSTGD